MGSLSIWHWVVVAVIVMLLFGGRGKIPSLMADVAKGIKSFKTSMKEDKDETEGDGVAAKRIDAEPAQSDKAAKS